MRVAIVNGLPQNERKTIWKIIANLDEIKMKMLNDPKHASLENSQQIYHFYRD
jgi:hypothetical protein